MISNIYIQALAAILLMGCATSQTVQSNRSRSLESIDVGRTERPGCKEVDGFSLVCHDRNVLVNQLKEQALKKGGNYVKVTRLLVGQTTGKVTASGIVMICPVADQAAPNSPSLTNRTTLMPQSGPDASSSSDTRSPAVPTDKDENPFE